MTEIPQNLRVEYAASDARRCHRTIVLNGHTYRCARNQHNHGIHDADQFHGDGRPVRW